MDVETLRLFCEVARRLSFAAVAEDRGLNPASVSRAVAQLENELGVRLFQRTTRRMALTEGGALLHRRVVGILDALDEARDQARGVTAGPAGLLRMTTSVAFGERLVVPLLPGFRAAFPDLKLELILTDWNVDLVAENIDLAVRLGPRIEANVVATRLFRTRYRVCASPAYLARAPMIRAPDDLRAHRCVLYTLPAFRSAWRFRPARRPDAPAVTVPIDGDVALSSALSLRSAVLAGAGPALLAEWLVRDDVAAGRLVELLGDYEVAATEYETAAWILYPSRSYLPLKVRTMVDFLKDRLAGTRNA